MHENKKDIEYVILVAVDIGEDQGAGVEASLDELEELAETAGAVVVGRMVQKLPHFNPATYIGSGKIEELQYMILDRGATGIITDDELSPAQMYNLGKALDTKVMDRTMVILDIFAAHARTAEGKLQVELAQLEYRLSRLTGKGISMSRLGGGIGTRGPGEKKLEQDRRVIRNRVAQLKRELEEVVSHRELTRKGRKGGDIPTFAIVGYTNVGKSTLLNALTGARILAEDKLFATLDTTTRVFEYTGEGSGKQKVLLTDTVGFIRKLPHNLIDAFRSTLEEVCYADYIIHVVDASSANWREEMKVVYETLDILFSKNNAERRTDKNAGSIKNNTEKNEGRSRNSTGKTVDGTDSFINSSTYSYDDEPKKIITIFNKMDKLTNPDDRLGLLDKRASKVLQISAKEGTGLSQIGKSIDMVLREDRVYIEELISFREMSRLARIKSCGEILEEKYREEGVWIRAYVPYHM